MTRHEEAKLARNLWKMHDEPPKTTKHSVFIQPNIDKKIITKGLGKLSDVKDATHQRKKRLNSIRFMPSHTHSLSAHTTTPSGDMRHLHNQSSPSVLTPSFQRCLRATSNAMILMVRQCINHRLLPCHVFFAGSNLS